MLDVSFFVRGEERELGGAADDVETDEPGVGRHTDEESPVPSPLTSATPKASWPIPATTKKVPSTHDSWKCSGATQRWINPAAPVRMTPAVA